LELLSFRLVSQFAGGFDQALVVWVLLLMLTQDVLDDPGRVG
jgi:hypothetical protein